MRVCYVQPPNSTTSTVMPGSPLSELQQRHLVALCDREGLILPESHVADDLCRFDPTADLHVNLVPLWRYAAFSSLGIDQLSWWAAQRD
jgi:hypothetical protein